MGGKQMRIVGWTDEPINGFHGRDRKKTWYDFDFTLCTSKERNNCVKRGRGLKSNGKYTPEWEQVASDCFKKCRKVEVIIQEVK
jgi:hypothetical protein